MLATIWLLPPKNECHESVTCLCAGAVTYTATYCIVLYRNWIINGQSFQSVLVYHYTTMHAMSHRAYFFDARSSRVNISEPAIFSSIPYLLTFFQFRLPSNTIPTAMSDSQSLKTLLLEVKISSKNECVFIGDLNDLTLKIIFDAWWASMRVGSTRSITCKNSRHAPSWQFYLHCGMEETSSRGIICIVCDQVLLHPSERGTSSMGKHLQAKAHITKLNELTLSEIEELTSSPVDEAALVILKRQGSCGITIVSSQEKFLGDIDFYAILTVSTHTMLQTSSWELFNHRISPRHLESLPDVRVCFDLYTMERYIKPWAAAVI